MSSLYIECNKVSFDRRMDADAYIVCSGQDDCVVRSSEGNSVYKVGDTRTMYPRGSLGYHVINSVLPKDAWEMEIRTRNIVPAFLTATLDEAVTEGADTNDSSMHEQRMALLRDAEARLQGTPCHCSPKRREEVSSFDEAGRAHIKRMGVSLLDSLLSFNNVKPAPTEKYTVKDYAYYILSKYADFPNSTILYSNIDTAGCVRDCVTVCASNDLMVLCVGDEETLCFIMICQSLAEVMYHLQELAATSDNLRDKARFSEAAEAVHRIRKNATQG